MLLSQDFLAGDVASKRVQRVHQVASAPPCPPPPAAGFQVERVRSRMMFRRSISCLKHGERLRIAPGSFSSLSLARRSRDLAQQVPAILSTISARAVAAAAGLGHGAHHRLDELFTCSVRNVRSALLCSPKISGESNNGGSIAARSLDGLAVRAVAPRNSVLSFQRALVEVLARVRVHQQLVEAVGFARRGCCSPVVTVGQVGERASWRPSPSGGSAGTARTRSGPTG